MEFVKFGDTVWPPCPNEHCKFWIHGEHYHSPKPSPEDEPVEVITVHTEAQQEAMRVATVQHQAAMLERMNQLRSIEFSGIPQFKSGGYQANHKKFKK